MEGGTDGGRGREAETQAEQGRAGGPARRKRHLGRAGNSFDPRARASSEGELEKRTMRVSIQTPQMVFGAQWPAVVKLTYV